MTKIKGYKGFDPDWKCLDFQYELGKKYTEKGEIKLCSKGFHFVEVPLDVFKYYPLSYCGKYAEIEAWRVSNKKVEDDSKRVARDIRIVKEMSVEDLAKAFVKQILDGSIKFALGSEDEFGSAITTNDRTHAVTTGYKSLAVTTGDRAYACTTGWESSSITVGYNSHSITTDYCSNSVTMGHGAESMTTVGESKSVTLGDYTCSHTVGNKSPSAVLGIASLSKTEGDDSHSMTSGKSSTSTTTGKKSHSVAVGHYSDVQVGDKESIAASLGVCGQASGVLGSWLVLAEYEFICEEWKIKRVKSVKVDGKKIKPDTFYRLVRGKFTEVKE